MMHTPIGNIPPFSQQVAERETRQLIERQRRQARLIACSNVAVRTADLDAFLGVIATREDQIARPTKFKGAAGAMQVASFALAAKEAIISDCPNELAIAHLEACAAFAIGMLAQLKEEN